MHLHEVAPVGGRTAGGRHWRRFARQPTIAAWSSSWTIRSSGSCGGSPVIRGVRWLTSSKLPYAPTSKLKRSPTSSPLTLPPPNEPSCRSCRRSSRPWRAAGRPRPMRRAEVWWAELPPPRTSRGLPTEVSVGRTEGLPRPSVVNTDNILTVPRQRLVRLMGQFSSGKIDELDRALKIALGLDSSDEFSKLERPGSARRRDGIPRAWDGSGPRATRLPATSCGLPSPAE
jgi:hypothetical protein